MLEIYNSATEVQIWIGDAMVDDNVELLFRVASNRYDYAVEKQIMDRFPSTPTAEVGNRVGPLILYSTNIAALKAVKKVAQRIGNTDVITCMANTSQMLATKPGQPEDEEDLTILCVGMRAVSEEEYDGANPIRLLMVPDFDDEHVQRMGERDWPDFESYLREVMRPPEDTLSNADKTRVFTALRSFCNRPYWQRAWIVQEVLVSRKATILCGEQSIDFEVFCAVYGMDKRKRLEVRQFWSDDMRMWDAAASVEVDKHLDKEILQRARKQDPGHQGVFGEGYSTMSQMSYHRLYNKKHELNLARISENYCRQKATDPKDHVFSLVGLLRHWSRQPREQEWCQSAIDYAKETREVFLDAAKHMVEAYDQDPRRQHILFHFGQREDSTMDLPSWAPDWSAKKTASVFDTRGRCDLMDLVPYQARVDGESLYLSGHHVDRITTVSEELENSTNNDGMYAEVDMYKQIVEDMGLGKVYGDDQSRSEAFWRTIIADNPIGTKSSTEFQGSPFGYFQEHTEVKEWVEHAQANYSRICELWSTLLKYRSTVCQSLKQYHGERPKIPSQTVFLGLSSVGEEDANGLTHVLNQTSDPEWRGLPARSELGKHHFLVTEQGYFGLCPPNVTPGDCVILLAGTRAPWYLRKTDDHYKIIGSGFVHGLMWKHDTYYQGGWKDGDIEMIELR